MSGTYMNGSLRAGGNGGSIYIRLHVLHGALYLLDMEGHFGHLS